jgi:hypothetical protein
MEENNAVIRPTVISVGLKFGLILGLVSIAITMITIAIGNNPVDDSWLNRLLSLVLGVIAVVLAHKNFKDRGDGFMNYGQGLGIAVIVCVVSMILSAIILYLYLNFIDPSVYDAIWEKAEEDMIASGNTEDQIEMGLSIAKRFFWLIFAMAGAFWGLIIGLIVTIFTQNKAPETAF